MSHPFRFSVSLGSIDDPHDLVAAAMRAEELGYDGVTLPDHLDGQVGPLVGLTAAAVATETLTITTLVLANDYRHPAVLAKELATLDRVSGGRLEVGIGAGWMTADYEQAGITKDRAGVRIARLAEAIEVLRGCWTGEPFEFDGEHYTIRGLVGSPAPHRPSGPPLIVAGGGPRVLGLAAREADIVGVNFGLQGGVFDTSAAATGFAEATDAKLALIREAAGDRFDSLELQTRVHLAGASDDRDATLEAMAPVFGLTVEQAGSMPHALAGTVDQCVATIEGWRDRWGLSYITWSADAMEPMAPVVAALSGR